MAATDTEFSFVFESIKPTTIHEFDFDFDDDPSVPVDPVTTVIVASPKSPDPILEEIDLGFNVDFMKCQHNARLIDGKCSLCNEQIEKPHMSARAAARISVKRPPIMDHLDKYPFSDIIKNKACEIFQSLNLTNLRDESRRMALCYCIFQAHAAKGIHAAPLLIGKKLGLNRQQVSRAMSRYENNKSNLNLRHDGYVDPIELIPQYAEEFRFTADVTSDMKDDFKSLIKKSPDLLERPPCTLVAAFMWYYMFTNGIKIDEESFANVFLLKFATIRSVSNEISKIDNL